MERISIKSKVVIGIIVITALTRLFPIANFSPLAAIGLFGGAYLSKRFLAIGIPVMAVFLSDMLLNNTVYSHMNDGFTVFYEGWAWQYTSYALIAVLGILAFKKGVTGGKVLGASVLASLVFFLVSNFGVWASGLMYPMNGSGLVACYAAGLPFLKGTMLGDLFYSGFLFGGYHLLQRQFGSLRLDPIRNK